MAAFTIEFPSITDLCPGPNLILWTNNLKTVIAQRLTKPWQHGVSLIPDPFQPDKTLVEVRRQQVITASGNISSASSKVIYPRHSPTSMSDPQAPSTTESNYGLADFDNAVRIVLTMHGTFKDDFAYIVEYFHKMGHKDVNLAFVSGVWGMYKNSARYGDGWVKGLALRWPVERA
ncbi:hypothetical protein MMC18_002388 [Xylographa bjoerkii]|nr:hypothetical protein [Xylographa bjoerkii]